MNTNIKTYAINIIHPIRKTQKLVNLWLEKHPKTAQWLWFIILWAGGLLTITILTYPLKLLIKNI